MSKRKIIILCVLALIFSTYSFSFSEKNDSQYVKIGLRMPLKSSNQVKITAKSGLSIGILEEDFKEIAILASDFFIVRIDSYYSIEQGEYILKEDVYAADIGPYHIEIEDNYDTYDDAIRKVNELKKSNIRAYPVYDDGFKVWIGQYKDEEIAERDRRKLKNIIKDASIVNNSGTIIMLQDNKNEIQLAFNIEDNIYLKSVGIEEQSGTIGVEEYNYRDFLTFNISENQLILINYVEINHYLYGVVPREMSANWAIEALKAQAIAARNYVIVNKNKHISLGYDLCDTQDCQVYGGYNWENNKTNRAVDETRHELIKYKDKPIYAYYHSSSGGHTEDSENIWTYQVPYLRGVEDEFSLGSPNDNWQLILNKDEIEEKLIENDIDLGEVISIEPMSLSKYGRVLELLVKGTKGTEILEKEKVRKIFGYGYVKSTWYRVNSDADVYVMNGDDLEPEKTTLSEYSIISEKGIQITSRGSSNRYRVTNGVQNNMVPVEPNSYIFDGKGWGHGLGMSQWGAKRMAEMGYNYKEILEYYYTGTKVE